MGDLREDRVRKKVFLFAAVIKDAGLQDFVRIGRTLGATLQNTIRYICTQHVAWEVPPDNA